MLEPRNSDINKGVTIIVNHCLVQLFYGSAQTSMLKWFGYIWQSKTSSSVVVAAYRHGRLRLIALSIKVGVLTRLGGPENLHHREYQIGSVID
jgi:hypothetical protein